MAQTHDLVKCPHCGKEYAHDCAVATIMERQIIFNERCIYCRKPIDIIYSIELIVEEGEE